MNFNKEVDKRFTPSDVDKIREFTLSDSDDVVKSLGLKLADNVLKFYNEWTADEENWN